MIEIKETPVKIYDIEKKQLIATYPSQKRAAVELFAGTKAGLCKIRDLVSGRIRKSYCPKLHIYITARYA